MITLLNKLKLHVSRVKSHLNFSSSAKCSRVSATQSIIEEFIIPKDLRAIVETTKVS